MKKPPAKKPATRAPAPARRRTKQPILAISLGCPAGVGPEIALAASAECSDGAPLLIGCSRVVLAAARLVGVERRVVLVDDARAVRDLPAGSIAVWAPSRPLEAELRAGAPDRAAGAAQLAWIDEAMGLVAQGAAQALVTGPVSKHAIATSGAPGARSFRGHTEHLAERLGAREVVMAFWSDALVTALVTTHLPLAKVARAIRPEAVASTTYWLARLLRALGRRTPAIAVASLNPHAGEGGLLGREEIDAIAPGIVQAESRLAKDGLRASLTGPLGAETAYRRAAARDFDGVVAMYHDQATIPSKLVAFGDAVNVTLGLPILRTSVDHGTAYDVAWRRTADPRGMAGALALAARLARSTAPPIATDRP